MQTMQKNNTKAIQETSRQGEIDFFATFAHWAIALVIFMGTIPVLVPIIMAPFR